MTGTRAPHTWKMYLNSGPGAVLLISCIYTSCTPSPPGHRVSGYTLTSFHTQGRQKLLVIKLKKSNCSPSCYWGGGSVIREIIKVKTTNNYRIYKE